MTQKLANYITQIDQLQGLIYQNLMDTFNDISSIRNEDLDNLGNISNLQQLKHTVLSKINKSTEFINGPKFRIACITCKAVRIIGLLKYTISSKYLSDEEKVKFVGQVITDYKIEKKYTEDFYNLTKEAKEEITKFITNKQLRKKFHLNDFCLQILNQEQKLISQTFPEDKEINVPEWLETLNQKELEEFVNTVIELLENKDYEAFLKLTECK